VTWEKKRQACCCELFQPRKAVGRFLPGKKRTGKERRTKNNLEKGPNSPHIAFELERSLWDSRMNRYRLNVEKKRRCGGIQGGTSASAGEGVASVKITSSEEDTFSEKEKNGLMVH